MEGEVGLREEPGRLLWPQGRQSTRKRQAGGQSCSPNRLAASVFSVPSERKASARARGGEEAGVGEVMKWDSEQQRDMGTVESPAMFVIMN